MRREPSTQADPSVRSCRTRSGRRGSRAVRHIATQALQPREIALWPGEQAGRSNRTPLCRARAARGCRQISLQTWFLWN